jgi:hypothetical protein
MGVAAVAHFMLPDSPYAMWVRDELAGYLHLPKDGTRVEVIGGEIVVSPAPPSITMAWSGTSSVDCSPRS